MSRRGTLRLARPIAVWILAAALLCSCGPAPVKPTPQRTSLVVPMPEDMQFLEWWAQREFEALREALEDASRETPQSPQEISRAWSSLGHWYRIHGFPLAARSAYQRASELEPDDPRWLYYLSLACTDAGMAPEADAALGRALELAPGFFLATARLGELHLAAGDAAGAETWLARALELNPGSSRVRRGLGAALIELGRPEEALLLLAEADRQQPNDRRTRLLIERAQAVGVAPADAGEPVGEDEPPGPALQPQVTGPVPAGELSSASWQDGRRLAWQGRHAEAVVELRRTLGAGLSRQEPEAMLRLVYSLRRTDDRIAALTEELALLRRFPAYGNVLKGGIEPVCGDAIYFMLKKPQQFLENPDVRFELARLLACTREPEQSLRELEEIVGRWPEHEYARLLLARLLTATASAARRDAERALSLIEEAPQRDTVFSLESWAMVQAALGDFERAVEIQSKANVIADLRGAPHEWTRRRLWRYSRGLTAEVVLDWDEGFF